MQENNNNNKAAIGKCRDDSFMHTDQGHSHAGGIKSTKSTLKNPIPKDSYGKLKSLYFC
jgi:hypothetical protein